ncbi:MAG: dicarboxylate/amino acid:cation symporter [Oscillospiraceae bacterium]|nr:dicarboxylate/amino acid:cation symporter [Oscillospiraceae bacterium]
MEANKKKLSLAFWIFLGLLLGIVAGFAFMGAPHIAVTYIKPFGTLFLNLIKMIVVPIVLFSIIQGVISLEDIRKVGYIGGRTVVFYLITTMFAISLGLLFANVLNVGGSANFATQGLEYQAAAAPSFIDTIINIFPSNAFAPMVNASMLQIIVIAIFFGFGIILAGEKGKAAADFADSMTEVSMQIMGLIIKLSPIGVFALICPVVAENGLAVLGSLARLIAITYLVYIIHAVFVYSTMVGTVGKLGPVKFFKGIMPAMVLAFSSASSVGTLPLNINCCEKLGARKEVASFVLPLGATINMDGTAIYQGVSAMFIAQVFGVELTIAQMITIVLTATLASIGTAGVPGSGMIMLAMVLESVGLPLEGIALIAGVDRILDMGRTVVNITGDAACTMCVDAVQKKKEARA